MPKENIDRAIKKGTGELEGAHYQEVTYEGYGPGGAAILIEATTDNPNRTVAEIRHAFSRNGGNLGASDSVAWMFDRKGQIYLDATKYDEDSAWRRRSTPGAEDFAREGDQYRRVHRRRTSTRCMDALKAKRLRDRVGRAGAGAEEHREGRGRGRRAAAQADGGAGGAGRRLEGVLQLRHRRSQLAEAEA